MIDKTQEKSSCGVGFIVSRTGRFNHDIVGKGLTALKRMEHRGATAIDLKTGDGAGIMTDIPFQILDCEPGKVAVATLFISSHDPEVQRKMLDIFEETFDFWGLKILKYRPVPMDKTVLGKLALKTLPKILHAIIQRPTHSSTDAAFDKALHIAKQMTITRQRGIQSFQPQCFFFTSLSASTIVYKALTTSELLDRFYLDLQNSEYLSRFALFHRRFSTNTESSWDRAQPFRLIAHNGEINTIVGNRSWAYSCEKSIGLPPSELVAHDGISDSGSVNEMVEALIYRSSLPHVEDCLALMMPPADQNNSYYKFWGRTMEPWDGPALIAFSNGESIGARLDRNGFRPCRWVYTTDHFYLASEAGAFEVDEGKIIQKGALRAGRGLKIELATGEIVFRDPCQSPNNLGVHFDARLVKLGYRSPTSDRNNSIDKFLFNVTQEEHSKILRPMILEGKESIGSMGDTARLAILSEETRPLFDYFYQNFAQVTNPPFDYLRETMITDLCVYLGQRPNLFAKKELVPPPLAFELPSPVLSLGQLEYLEAPHLQICTCRFNMTFDRHSGAVDLHAQLKKISCEVVKAVKRGASIVILSDSEANWERLPIPALIMLRSVIRALNVEGLRLKVSIVIDSGQIRTTHQLSATIGFGATAVCPRLGLELARNDQSKDLEALTPDAKEKNLIKALESGLLKVMSKMGISVVRSYQGAKLFTIIGLSQNLCKMYFRGVQTLLGGLDLDDIVATLIRQAESAQIDAQSLQLRHTYQLREHPSDLSGEKHSMTSSLSRMIHRLVKEKNTGLDSINLYDEYLKRGFDDQPVNVRHLLSLKQAEVPVSLSEVQSASDILTKFGSGAMSFGAISAEAQRDIILAMKEVGGRSNSGEGGENPYYYTEGVTASTKQIASARFGVTAKYLVTGQEFQIKMAQGAKPGEGGQLMAAKVSEDIARARHSMTNVDLISPPPMHDIYSIEDLKQLIYELKQIKPNAKVGVKIVSGAHIGTIAVGIAKAGADIIQISGNDGGTGAAPISSMKHAGLPFEFGLLEVHKALVENGLRNQCTLRVDGGLRNGKDIVMAAAMGAEEFDFGKLLLIAEGCVMARICEKNMCPAGIATHDPKFKARYKGSKEKIISLLSFISEDVRRHLASIGVHSLQEIVGRTDFLQVAIPHLGLIKRRKLDLSFALRPALALNQRDKRLIETSIGPLNKQIAKDCITQTIDPLKKIKSLEFNYKITTTDRAIPATLCGLLAKREHHIHLEKLESPHSIAQQVSTQKIQLSFTGSAGQGFGVFLVDGVKLLLFGEANDSVGKTMSGGKIIVRPSLQSKMESHKNVIIGNCGLYGATGGTAYISGIAGDRFAVRNSGALAVVEGTGLHACEYMTNGTVIILGPSEQNIGSGMTGGELFLFGDQTQKVNSEFLSECQLTLDEEIKLKGILSDYLIETESSLALQILANWDESKSLFKIYIPKKGEKRRNESFSLITPENTPGISKSLAGELFL